MVRSDHGLHAPITPSSDTAQMYPAPVLLACGLAIAAASPACWAQAVPAPAATATPAAAAPAEPRFDILEYELEGNTRLSQLEVERLLLPHMGEGRTLATVEAARAALERAYQAGGWLSVLVDIPEQRVADGLVKLRVTEGAVDRVRITGALWFDQDRILRRLPAVQPGQVPDFNALQAQLAELNRNPDRQVQPVLRPGLLPGTVEVEFKVRDSLPVSGSVELHNRHAEHSEPLRLSATLRHDNLFQLEHSLSLSLATAPRQPSQTQTATLSYGLPLGADQSLQLSYTYSNSLNTPLGNTVIGRGDTLSLRWSLARFEGRDSHSLTLGAEWRDLQQRVRAGTGAASDGSGGSDGELSTPLRYLPLSLGWNGQFQHGAGARASSTQLGATLTLGLRPLNERRIACPGTVGAQDQFHCNREGADGGFGVLRLEARHSRPLPGGWPGSLAFRMSGQLAAQPLVSGEQMVAGGADSVRGFLESSASGDLGLITGIEARSAELSPAVRRALGLADDAGQGLGSLQLLGFVDAAQLQVHDAQPGQAARRRLAGAGLGLRLRAGVGGLAAQADLDLAWPLNRDARQRLDGPRLHARLALPF